MIAPHATPSLPVLRRPPKHAGLMAFAVARSEDSKLTSDPVHRPIAATYVSQASCPPCPVQEACYAKYGNAGRITWRLNRNSNLAPPIPGELARLEAEAIDALPSGWPIRLHVVGDCPTDEDARIVAAAARRYMRRSLAPVKVWTYTHAWRTVARSSWGPISVLASCETDQDLVEATARGYACELTRSHQDLPTRVGGLLTIKCPEQTGTKPDCASCMLCAKDLGLAGKAVIVLQGHGPVRKLSQALKMASESTSGGSVDA